MDATLQITFFQKQSGQANQNDAISFYQFILY